MGRSGRSFDALSEVLDQISDREVSAPVALVRKHRAGLGAQCAGHDLQAAIAELDHHELRWLDAVLCVRAQQIGREAAWRRSRNPPTAK